MKAQVEFVGLDVHKDTIVAAVLGPVAPDRRRR